VRRRLTRQRLFGLDRAVLPAVEVPEPVHDLFRLADDHDIPLRVVVAHMATFPAKMSDLLSRVPRTATRHRKGTLDEVPLDDIEPDDLLLVRQGHVAPVDGIVDSDRAMPDRSALTGESMPARLSRGRT